METGHPNASTESASDTISAEQRAALAAAGIKMPDQPPAPRAIDRIIGAFSTKMWHIDVPEWDNLRIYFTALTTADVQIIEANAASVTDAQDRNLLLLIHKARDEQGKPLFTSGDIVALKNMARFDVVKRVTAFMYTCGSLTVEQAKDEVGNASSSATTSPSPSASA